MEERDKGRLLANLKSLPHELNHLLQNLSEEELTWRPLPNRPTIGETLLLLRDFEHEAFQMRLRDTAEKESPSFQAWDVNAALAQRGYETQDARTALGEFGHMRKQTVDFLQDLPLEKWSRTSTVADRGESSIEDHVVWQIKNFDLTNLVQIKDILRIKMPW